MLNYLADLYLQEGQLAQAEAAIRGALQNNSSLPSAEQTLGADDFMILAKVLSKQGRHQEAYEAGRHALALFRPQFGARDKFFVQMEEMVEELRRNVTHKERETADSASGNLGLGRHRNGNIDEARAESDAGADRPRD
jgi:tetratricopeptide (TPR) repeat protein